MKKYSIIGDGNIGGRLFDLLNINCPKHDIKMTNRSTFGKIKIISESNIVFITVKPKDIKDVANDINQIYVAKHIKKVSYLRKGLVVSMMAGIKMEKLQEMLSWNQPIIRCMPNLPISEKSGCLVCYSNKNTTLEHRKEFTEILKGPDIIWIDDEKYMNAITSISGCGPAFLSVFYKFYIQAAIDLGLPPDLAKKSIYPTIIGTTTLISKEYNKDPSKDILSSIISQVASKGGATEQGLDKLLYTSMQKDLTRVFRSCKEHCDELDNL